MEIQPSYESKRKALFQNGPSPQYVQFGELLRTVNQLTSQNRRKYEQILQSRPHFGYQLYKVHDNKDVSLNFGRELLMKQLDKLMEEEHFLNRELSLITIRKEEDIEVQQSLIQKEISPFEVLRSVWSSGSRQYENSVDHADSLNHILGHIKLTIRKITDIEKDTSAENQQQYLETAKELRQPSRTCQNCKSEQQSKKQLRGKIESLEEQLSSLMKAKISLEAEVAKRDDSLRRLNKKIIELQTEYQSKVMYLQEKLLLEDHQIKQLKKFKSQLEKNMFKGQQYQLFIKTQEDLSDLDKTITVELEELLTFVTSRSDNHSQNRSESASIHQQPKLDLQDELLLELALPIGKSDKPKKPYLTQRPKTQRRIAAMTQNMVKLEELETFGKKYMRTNQLTTKRNRQAPVTPLESKHTISTLQLSQSPKSIEQQ